LEWVDFVGAEPFGFEGSRFRVGFMQQAAPESFHFKFSNFDGKHDQSYYRARYYDSAAGRFLGEDRIGFIGGPDFYIYVDNGPVDSSDPTGLCKQPCPVPVPSHPPSADVAANMAQAQQNGISWWYVMVKTSQGPWDYKYQDGQPRPEYDAFGNFNFGATGCAIGIPLNILERGAGWFKSARGFGHWWWRFPYGDQPDKQDEVANGYKYCQKCMVPTGDYQGP
jgi:RHS repeat-associated protein